MGSMGNAMAFIAIPWLVIELTGSATSTGIVVGISFLPVIVMAPLAGILIDRWGRRQVSILSDILSGISVALIPLIALTGNLTVTAILFAALLGAVFDPAGYTARKTLIQPVAQMSGLRLERANSLHEALFAFGFSIGPALGTFIIGLLGSLATFWVIGAMSLTAAVLVSFLGQVARASDLDDTDAGTWWREALNGFIWLRKDRALLVLTVFFIAVEFVYLPSEVVILPVYFQDIGNPLGMGLVVSAMATGGIVGSYAYDWLRKRYSNRAILIGSLLTSCTGLFGLAFFPPLWVMVVSGLIIGLFWGPTGPLINTLVQTRLPESVQGRVFGAQMALFSSGPPLGMVLVGGLVDAWGVFLIYPILVLAVWVLAWVVILLPALRSLNDPPVKQSDAV